MAELLHRYSYEPTHAHSFVEVRTLIAQVQPNLVVISDLGLDDEVVHFSAELKGNYPDIALLIVAKKSIFQDGHPILDLADAVLFDPEPVEFITVTRSLLRLNSHAVQSAAVLEAELEALNHSSIDAVISIEANDKIIGWNPAAERIFGFSASEVLGTKFSTIDASEEELAEQPQYLPQLLAGEPIEYQAIRQRKDGEQIEIWVRGAPVRRPDGQTIGASLIVRDVTALKQREQHVHFLMRELTHRSKNLLAVIQAMARQSLTHLNSPEEFVKRFSERLSGLAGSHDLLSNVDWAGASLIDLIRSQLRHYEDHFDKKIHLKGPDLFLRPEAAQNIGIALHELSTNAAKYGALSVPNGNVSISWEMKFEKDVLRLYMMWEEKGGPSVSPPSRKGFGHVVMDRITGQALGGSSRADFRPEGVLWNLDVPAASVVLEREKV